MRLLITRPEPDATQLKALLEARGHQAMVSPVATVRFLDPPAALAPTADAVMLTSANAARALKSMLPAASVVFALPVYAVGAKTAEAARQAGFANVTAAAGTVEALVREIETQADRSTRHWLYFSGDVVRHDPRPALARLGFTLDHHVVYTAERAETLSAPARAALREGLVEAVLFYSPRAVDLFIELAKAAQVEDTLSHIAAACLSDAVAARARHHGLAPLITAETPTSAALIAAVEAHGSPTMSEPAAIKTEGQPSATPKAARSGRWRIWALAGLLALVVAFIGGLFAMPALAPRLAPFIPWFAPQARGPELGPITAQLEALATRLEALEARPLQDALARRVDALEAAPAPAGDNTVAIDELKARLAAVEARPAGLAEENLARRLSALEARARQPLPNGEALAARLDALEAAMTALDARQDANARRMTALTALAQIREAVATGRAFKQSLAQLRQDPAAAGEALAKLEVHAASGVAASTALRARLAALAPDILRAAALPQAPNWWDRLRAWLGGLVTVRRLSVVSTATPAAILARGEARLAAGDVAGAVLALADLPDAARALPALADWLADARAHAEVEAALTALAARLSGPASMSQ
ncbi:MAG: uroporphyrinogen-III synthase [Pseudomonadota bacterium]